MRQRRPSDLQGGDMGSIVEASWHFTKEKHARWATHIIENHVKLCCAPFEGFEFDPESSGQSMSDLCLEHDEALRACDPLALPRDNALTHLRRDRTNVILDRCDDVQWMVHLGDWEPDDFFSQTCFSLARRFPQVPFVAYTRYEMTVDGYVRRTRASWNGERLQFRQIAGERPLDEDCWDTWEVYDWALAGGKLVRCEGSTSAVQKHFFALLDDAREAAAAGDARAALRFADGAAALPIARTGSRRCSAARRWAGACADARCAGSCRCKAATCPPRPKTRAASSSPRCPSTWAATCSMHRATACRTSTPLAAASTLSCTSLVCARSSLWTGSTLLTISKRSRSGGS